MNCGLIHHLLCMNVQNPVCSARSIGILVQNIFQDMQCTHNHANASDAIPQVVLATEPGPNLVLLIH